MQHITVSIFHQKKREKEKKQFGAIFNLPFHSMPTIQSQEMLCQGTKEKRKKRVGIRNLWWVLSVVFFKIHIDASLSDNNFTMTEGHSV